MRLPILAKLGSATIAVVAATGGLAVAGALPAPVQDLMPVGTQEAEDPVVEVPLDEVLPPETATDEEPGEEARPENHGALVSQVAKDRTLQGCEHGRAVSAAASGKVNDKPCPAAGEDEVDPALESEEVVEPGERPANHGATVSSVAKDRSRHGCEHGRAVSAAASGKVKDKPCPAKGTDAGEPDPED